MTTVSMLGASLAFVACGSSDEKRRLPPPGDAGAAGDAGGAAGAMGGGGGIPAGAGKGGGSSAGFSGEGGGAIGTSGETASGGAGGVASGGYSVEPTVGDTFASPSGSDTDNDCPVEETPCKTITRAAAQAAAAHTVWLATGTFTNVDQPLGASLVDGIRVRARELGEAIVQVRLALLGSHCVEGLVFDGSVSQTHATAASIRLLELLC